MNNLELEKKNEQKNASGEWKEKKKILHKHTQWPVLELLWDYEIRNDFRTKFQLETSGRVTDNFGFRKYNAQRK